MRNMAVLHSPAFSYPLPVLVRVLFNLLIFKGKILYYNKYRNIKYNVGGNIIYLTGAFCSMNKKLNYIGDSHKNG